MIDYKLKLSKLEDLKQVVYLTDLTDIEIKAIIKLKAGEAVVYDSGAVEIRNRNTKKVLWRNN